jgi:hypothetical protein
MCGMQTAIGQGHRLQFTGPGFPMEETALIVADAAWKRIPGPQRPSSATGATAGGGTRSLLD